MIRYCIYCGCDVKREYDVFQTDTIDEFGQRITIANILQYKCVNPYCGYIFLDKDEEDQVENWIKEVDKK